MEALPIWTISDADKYILQRIFLVRIKSGMLGNPSSSRYAEERPAKQHYEQKYFITALNCPLPLQYFYWTNWTLDKLFSVFQCKSEVTLFHIVSYAILSINFSKSAWEGLFSIFKLLYNSSIHSFKKMWQNSHYYINVIVPLGFCLDFNFSCCKDHY